MPNVTPSMLANSIMGKIYDVLTNGDDTVPASLADANLSAVKTIARDSASPRSRLLANKAIDQLDFQVQQAVSEGRRPPRRKPEAHTKN